MTYILFYICHHECALPISCVREVLRAPVCLPLPDCPEGIDGVIRIRKHLIAVMDLAKHFDPSGSTTDPKASHVILLKWDPLIMGLRVDAVTQLMDIDTDQCTPTTSLLGSFPSSPFIKNIAQDRDHPIYILDVPSLFAPCYHVLDKGAAPCPPS